MIYRLIDPRDGMTRYVGRTMQKHLCQRLGRHRGHGLGGAVIYRLIDPRDGMTRYVGRTMQKHLCQRLGGHMYASRRERHPRGWTNPPVTQWIRGMAPLRPFAHVLVPNGDTAEDELLWINRFRALGFPLLNAYDTRAGRPKPEEFKRRVSLTMKGRPKPHETIARMREAQRAKSPLTPADVKELRELWASGRYSQRELGERFGIGQASVSKIVLYRTWKEA